MKKKHQKYLLYILSYLYLFIGFSFIIFYISYDIRITNKPMGWAIMLFNALLYYIAYVAINHILIKRIINSSNKLLIIIEALLFVAMLTLVISDLRYENYLHIQWFQKTMANTIPL